MFRINNYWIDELLRMVVQSKETDKIIATIDELQNASVNVTAESTDVTDHKGNLVKRTYRAKSGEFTATNAYLSTVAQNLGSGSEIQYAGAGDAAVEMPKIEMVKAGESLTLVNPVEGSIRVQGIYKDGGNGYNYKQSTAAVHDADEENCTFKLDGDVLTVPAAGDDAPLQYVVLYQRSVESGMVLSNNADDFPKNVKATIQCSYYTPCNDLKPCYLYFPSMMFSPETEISLDSENQTMDISASILIDACGTEKTLYVLYFPEEGIVTTGTVTPEPPVGP